MGINTFVGSGRQFPTQKEYYDVYIKRLRDFDVKHGILLKKKCVEKESYELIRHYYALGVE